MAIDFKSMSKKSLALVIVGGLIAIGAVVADVVLIVKLIEQWKTLVAAGVLTGAAVGCGIYVVKALKAAATKV